MRLRVEIAVVAACVSVALASATFAQEPPKVQAGGGYMHIVDPWAAFNSPMTPADGLSWYTRGIGNVTPQFGPIAEVSGSHYGGYGHKGIKGSARIYSILGGVRVSPLCCARVSPFAHALAGMVHSRFRGEAASFADATESHCAFAFGGGADIRAAQVAADLMRVRHHENYSAWTLRISAGVMLPGR